MEKCRNGCAHFNRETQGCDLISGMPPEVIEDLMDSDAETLSRFLFQNECHGDFQSMLKKGTTKTPSL